LTKQAPLIRRSTVLSLPLQLVFLVWQTGAAKVALRHLLFYLSSRWVYRESLQNSAWLRPIALLTWKVWLSISSQHLKNQFEHKRVCPFSKCLMICLFGKVLLTLFKFVYHFHKKLVVSHFLHDLNFPNWNSFWMNGLVECLAYAWCTSTWIKMERKTKYFVTARYVKPSSVATTYVLATFTPTTLDLNATFVLR
jgi:hypothetical protein